MRLRIILVGLLVLVTLSVYWQVGSHDFITLDDPSYVVNNPHVATGLNWENIFWAFTSVHAANWHPLTWLSHMLDVQMFGMNPGAHHLVNVFIHIATTLLLFSLLTRLTGAVWRSAFVAALFALHPLHVESVAWVAERKDVLSAFFWMLTLICYAEYVRQQKFGFYLLAIFVFVLGIMSKPMLVTLPVIMLLFDVWPLNRYGLQGNSQQEQRPPDFVLLKSMLKEKIPFFVITVASSVVTIYAQGKGGAIKDTSLVPLWSRLENASTAYLKYILKMLWPTDLAFYYPFPASIPAWQFIGSLIFLISASVLTVFAVRNRPYLLTGWYWFFLTLVPVIGIIQVGGQGMADRYTYIPLVGLFVIVAWGVPELVSKLPFRQAFLALLATVIVVLSSFLTWQQLGHWRDSVSLYRHTVKVTSGSVRIFYNLGFSLAEQGLYDEAIVEYRKALQLYPDYTEARTGLGVALMRKGYLGPAIQEFVRVLEIDPNFLRARNNLGRVLAAQGYYDEAIRELQKAIEIDPGYAPAHESLRAVIQFRNAEIEEAKRRSGVK